MKERVEKAIALHRMGYNCAQSVVCAYADLFGMDESMAFRASEGFGAGMGGLRETCGAVTAMFFLAGLENSSGGVDKGSTKSGTYRLVRTLAEEFRQKNGSILCRDLLGDKDKPKLRSCDGCVEDACELVEKYLLKLDEQK